MTPEGRSLLLNRELPKDLADLLRREGVDPGAAWLCTETDLNLSGNYEQVFLVVEPNRLLTVGRLTAHSPKAVRIELARQDITEIRTRQGIGGGFNPHHAGFAAGCATQMRRNPRPCLVCHEPGEAALAQCR